MDQAPLLPEIEKLPTKPEGEPSGTPRVRVAVRSQVELVPRTLDDVLPADHRARAIWSVVERLDLSMFYAEIEARGRQAGRPAVDPRILIAVWLYATSQGVGSARQVAQLCKEHDGYRWLCGGVPMNHHTLSDFRVGHREKLDDLLTQVLAVMLHQRLVKLERIAQDGTRVRASAGAASFHRKATLEECLLEAKRQVEEAKRQREEGGASRNKRRRAAQERAARERMARVEAALAELPKVQETKARNRAKDEARVSTTDAEARVMKMPDGGFRPAYNVQLAADVGARVIVGVAVTNAGTDMGQMKPMLEQVEARTEKLPQTVLVDGGFTKLADIEHATQAGLKVLAPVPVPRKEGVEPHAAKPGDSPEVAQWRQRMGTEEAKEEYKLRGATIETVNADLKAWRGLTQVGVRGADKVLSVALWAALTYNVLRYFVLTGTG